MYFHLSCGFTTHTFIYVCVDTEIYNTAINWNHLKDKFSSLWLVLSIRFEGLHNVKQEYALWP